MEYTLILVDDPAPGVRRITLNHPLRGQLLDALHIGDREPDVRVQIIRGAGKSFSAGYDLVGSADDDYLFFTGAGEGQWPRHRPTAGWASGISRSR